MEVGFLQDYKVILFPLISVCVPSIKVFCDYCFSTMPFCFSLLWLSEPYSPCLVAGVVTANYGISEFFSEE